MSTIENAVIHAKYLPYGYRKRQVYVERVNGPRKECVDSYWDGGSKSDFTLHRGGSVTPVGRSPGFPNYTRQEIELQAGDVLVESGTFCGKTATARLTIVL